MPSFFLAFIFMICQALGDSAPHGLSLSEQERLRLLSDMGLDRITRQLPSHSCATEGLKHILILHSIHPTAEFCNICQSPCSTLACLQHISSYLSYTHCAPILHSRCTNSSPATFTAHTVPPVHSLCLLLITILF